MAVFEVVIDDEWRQKAVRVGDPSLIRQMLSEPFKAFCEISSEDRMLSVPQRSLVEYGTSVALWEVATQREVTRRDRHGSKHFRTRARSFIAVGCGIAIQLGHQTNGIEMTQRNAKVRITDPQESEPIENGRIPAPAATSGFGGASNRLRAWAVLLAGGDGTRLQSLTQKIAGDSRPKQFCQLFGGKSLLTQTRERVATLFRRSRTVCVVTQAHERFYREELRYSKDVGILVQPQNRGTAVAISVALFRISCLEPDALVAFFPSDHFYADEGAFTRMVRSAGAFARRHPKSVVLLGAQANYPEVEYGWIEPGVSIPGDGSTPLLSVNRFWEKPDLSTAEVLLHHGCLWNTFVTIGYASTFLELISLQIPDVTARIAAGVANNDLNKAYQGVRSADFSREVLAPQPHRLLAVRDVASGWTDLGTPARVIDTLVRNGIETGWLGNSIAPDAQNKVKGFA